MRKINRIVVHCSASDMPFDDSLMAIRELHTSPTTQKILWGKYHTYGKGFIDVGYHYIITKDGLELGRPIECQGAHVLGHNEDTIAICVNGRFHYSDKQLKILENLLRNLLAIFDLDTTDIYAHSDLDNSKPDCPGFNINTIKQKL